MNTLKIIFAGTPQFGLPCLDALSLSNHKIEAIYTQPDRPSGRGRVIHASPVKEWALAHHVPVYQPLNFKEAQTRELLAALKPDLMVVIAYGLILPKAVLDIPRLGCINVHASLLPRWRGASPIQHAVLAGDSQSGVTIMQMDEGLDTGAMLSKVLCPISPTDTAASLHDKLAQNSAQALLAVIDALACGLAQAEPQKNEQATYAGKIAKEDALIDWRLSAIEIDRIIRAFNPWPIAFSLMADQVLRIHKAKPTEIETNATPGTVLSLDKKGMLVATADKTLLVEKIQFPGAKTISIADWLNSGKTLLHAGLVLE